MTQEDTAPGSIDSYIAAFPIEFQLILHRVRAVIAAAAPEAEEVISYQMPTFRLHGNLVHFAAFPNHIGFYPTPSGILAFADALSGYKGGQGSVQFPLSQPIPYDLIGEITRFRVRENVEKAARKKRR